MAESVWDLKGSLEKVGSGLCMRVGMIGDVVKEMLSKTEEGDDLNVTGLWMVSEEGVEEAREERAVKDACREAGIEFRLWTDEKYLIDE
jgi:deoxyribodipyrimidine photo-lyase